MSEPTAWEEAHRVCLTCKRKPARRGSCFCSERCKAKLKGGLDAWASRLPEVERQEPSLFDTLLPAPRLHSPGSGLDCD